MNQVNESNRQISEITKVIAEIGNKTKVINDIVFQTKLLSFNASVEAARAGEHGKGFAVVAEEVGNLAQMSGTAAKEISEMLDSSIRKVESIVNDTKENVERLVRVGKDKVDAGRRVAEECSHVLDEIVGNVTDVSQMSSDIASASKDQAQGVREISKAMAQLDTVTQSNALAANIAAQAAEQISSQSTLLRGTVQSLMAIVDGGDANYQLSSYSARPAAKTQTPAKAPVPRRAAPAPKAEPAKPNVVKFEPKKAPAPRAEAAAPVNASSKSSAPIKLAAGADIEIPSENDPRFKDV
jgi:methyl-accepting chemotaxis protein